MVTGKLKRVLIVVTTGLFLVLVLLQLIFSFRAVKAAHEHFNASNQEQSSGEWNNMEFKKLHKDILWYEQLLMLSSSDSIYLTINLKDSIVQLKLKGMELAESRIIDQYPPDFFSNVNQNVYTSFATSGTILDETSNFAKKPVRKIVAYTNAAPENGDANENPQQTPLRWSIKSSNNLNIVITGVQTSADSSFVLHPRQDILRYRIHDFFNNPVPTKYAPTLYLWLKDKDAKAIYRAVPSGGEVLFRN